MGTKNGLYVSTDFKKKGHISKILKRFYDFATKKLQKIAKFCNFLQNINNRDNIFERNYQKWVITFVISLTYFINIIFKK